MPQADEQVDTDTTLDEKKVADDDKELETPESDAANADDDDDAAPTAEALKKAQNEANTLRRLLEKEKAKKGDAPINNKPQDQTVSKEEKDELRLVAKGFSEEAIAEVKAIAKGKGITLTEATEDPLFQAYQTVQEEAAKAAKAKLSASKGSGHGQPVDKNTVTPGMESAEHKELWKRVTSS